MKAEKEILNLFQQTTDYCCFQFAQLPEPRRDPFWNEFRTDPEFENLASKAEAEGDPAKVRELLRSYCKRFKQYVEAYETTGF